MSYDLLRGLYLGAATNADLSSYNERLKVHVKTDLDRVLPELARSKRDVVITGNPGDGKSHLVRTLQDRGRLDGVEVELDLSATTEEQVIFHWRRARTAGRALVLCGNEGPLTALLPHLAAIPELNAAARELRGQLGRQVVSSADEIPPEPSEVVLVDLADRTLLDSALIASAIRQVCLPEFFPDAPNARDTSAGRNQELLLESEYGAARLARVLVAAGGRCGEHVSFRKLWGAVSFAITAGKAQSTQVQEASKGGDELDGSPVQNLLRARGQGALLRAVRELGDPAAIPTPQLDEDLWAHGAPRAGAWEADAGPFTAPATWWANNQHELALAKFAALKRFVTLFHSAGEEVLLRMEADRDLPSRHADDALRALVVGGLRRLFLSGSEEAIAPSWLRAGLPLWVSHTYQEVPASERPYVAVAAVPASELELRRPIAAPWLRGGLGPAPEVAWLRHAGSGVALRLDPALLSTLRRADRTDGTLSPPETVLRFLARLSGWEEQRSAGRAAHMAVLDRPRGGLLAANTITQGRGGLAYGDEHVD